jgi:hypothetical protein
MPHGFRGWAIWGVAEAALTFAWRGIAKLAEHAMLTWSDDQIATFVGFSAPQASTVISWAIPALLGAATLFVYHLIQIRISKTPTAASIAGLVPVVSGTAPDASKRRGRPPQH